jgi:hypothetical protein
MRGGEEGSVDRAREGRGGPIEPVAALVRYGRSVMTGGEARLDLRQSFVVLAAHTSIWWWMESWNQATPFATSRRTRAAP